MTFPANYNLTKPKEENIRCVQCKKALYDLGIVTEAFKHYIARSNKNFPILSELGYVYILEPQ